MMATFLRESLSSSFFNLYGLLPYTEFLKQLIGLMRQLTFDMEDTYNSVMYVRSPLLSEVEMLNSSYQCGTS